MSQMKKKIKFVIPFGGMSIKDLSLKSGFGEATIYKYIREGLLNSPIKLGFRLSYFDKTHLDTLSRIKQFKAKKNHSLLHIKGILQSVERDKKTAPHMTDGQEHDLLENSYDFVAKKKQIAEKAMMLFSQLGYHETKISDITESLGIGKGTFYSYFKDKRDLFLDCIERLTLIILPKQRWEIIKAEHNPIQRLRVRAKEVLDVFPKYAGIFNLLRHALLGKHDRRLFDKATQVFGLLVRPGTKDIQWAVKHGIFRGGHEELWGYFYVAILEILGYKLLMDPHYTVEKGLDALEAFISNGMLIQDSNKRKNDVGTPLCGELTDSEKVKTYLRDILLDDKRYMACELGKATVKVELKDVDSLALQDSTGFTVGFNMKDGNRVVMQTSKRIIVSGECEAGLFSIPLGNVSGLSFFPST